MPQISSRLAIDLSGPLVRIVDGVMGGVMRCGSGSVPDSAMTHGKIIDRQAVGQVVKQLVARTEITETKAFVAVSDAVATFRVLRLPGAASDEDVTATVAKELPLDPERLATRWLDVGPRGEHRTVYAAAWDRAPVKEATEALRLAGLEPVAVELKSASVARATMLASCVVIDLTSDPVEVFLIDRNVPHVWHAVAATLNPEDVSQTLGAPLRAVLRFYRRHSGHDLPSTSPVLVSGEQALPVQALDRLAQQAEHPVLAMPAPARVPANVRHATYLACLGLLMRRAS